MHEVRIFSISEDGDNGLGDEGADEGNAPPIILMLEPPLSLLVLKQLLFSKVTVSDARRTHVKTEFKVRWPLMHSSSPVLGSVYL